MGKYCIAHTNVHHRVQTTGYAPVFTYCQFLLWPRRWSLPDHILPPHITRFVARSGELLNSNYDQSAVDEDRTIPIPNVIMSLHFLLLPEYNVLRRPDNSNDYDVITKCESPYNRIIYKHGVLHSTYKYECGWNSENMSWRSWLNATNQKSPNYINWNPKKSVGSTYGVPNHLAAHA